MKKEITEEEISDKAEFFIENLKKLVNKGEVSIIDLIETPLEIQPAIDFGAPFHEQFANLVLTIFVILYEDKILWYKWQTKLDKQQTELKLYNGDIPIKIRSYKDLPYMVVITDKVATIIGQFIDTELKEEKELILLTIAKTKGVQFSIEKLYEFATNP